MKQVLCGREAIFRKAERERQSLIVIKGRWMDGVLFFIIGGLVTVLTKGNRLAGDRKSISTLRNRGIS